MKTVLSHDPQGWLRDAQIGEYFAGDHVIRLENGSQTITVTVRPVTGGEVEFDVKPDDIDDVIRGLLRFRAALKVDRRKRARWQADWQATRTDRLGVA